MITQKYLKEVFTYNSNNGVLIYKKRINNRIQIGRVAGHISSDGYRYVRVFGTSQKHSRLVFLFHNGVFPKNNIDHINGNRSDDRIENLRDVTQEENRKNCMIMTNNSSGVQGVNFYKRTNKWRAFIGLNGKHIHLGYFDTKKLALEARKNAELEYDYHDNHGRIA